MKADNALAQRLKTVAQRYTQSEIARRTGTWVSNVHHYLNGTRVPADFLAALVEKCGVNAQWLLTGEGTPYTADLAPNAEHFAGDVQKLSRALEAASRLKLGELFSEKRTRVLAEINEALESYEHVKSRLAVQLDEPLGRLWHEIVAALNKHAQGDRAALAKAKGLLATLRQVVRLTDKPIRELEWLGFEGRVAVFESRFDDALALARRTFLMAFSVLGPSAHGFHEYAHRCATSLGRNGFYAEARVVLKTALPLARAAGNDPPWTAFCDVFEALCAAQTGNIEGAFEAATAALQRPGADKAVGVEDAFPMQLEIGLLSGRLDLDRAMVHGPNTLMRRRHLFAWAAWTEDVQLLRKLLRENLREVPPAADYVRRYFERWKRIASWVYTAAWKRSAGRWRELLKWDDREASISPLRENAVKTIRACQIARLCGETDKARELLIEAQSALNALPVGMDVFILERATHHRNALALGEAPKGSTKARHLRAQAQRWFREHAAKGYACFAGFGV